MPNIKRGMMGAAGAGGALKQSGTLWAWGDANMGQLGNGSVTDVSSPVQIGSRTDWAHIGDGCDKKSNIGVTTDGKRWGWGENKFGALGLGDTTNRSSPTQIGALTTWGPGTSVTSADYNSTLHITTAGTLFGAGLQDWRSLLGTGDSEATYSSPVQVGALTDWAQVNSGRTHSAAVKTDGTLWVWGQRGPETGNSSVDKSSPVQVGSLTDWAHVTCGADFCTALKTDNTVWSWGTAAGGLLGNGTTSPNISSPAQVGSLTDWKQIDADYSHTMAIKTDGTLWGWGGVYTEPAQAYSSPVQLGALTDWLQISAGKFHTMAIKTDYTLWAVGGTGWYGCFGNEVPHHWTNAALSSPVQIGSETDWIQVKCGAGHTHAIRSAS